ncbi:MAG: LPXTG cell wall anchor domain-containing protein [Clostridia bacterium]|nr:LPXTG cell wall anchor domain-containing protein [Clostridia bacterium]
MKKIMSVMMALMLIVMSMSVCAFSAQAAAAAVYTIQTHEYAEGDVIPAGTELSFDISLNDIPDGILTVEFKFRYDKTLLQPVEGVAKNALDAMDQKKVNLAPTKPEIGADHPTLGEIWITGMTLDAQATAADKPIATVTFKTLADISSDVALRSFGQPFVADSNFNQVNADVVNGGINFPEPTTTTTEAEVTTTTTAAEGDTTTTAADTDETTTTAATTTTTKVKDNPKTGEGDMWIVFAVIGVVAVAAIVGAVVAKKRHADED